MSDPIHIFKPGRHVSMAGEAIEFSQADIEATARAYNPKLHEAPFVIGHPKTDDPAHGWARSLLANERGLFATPRDVAPAFAESVNKREFAKVSSKFYRPTDPNNPVPGVWYLRHVGFLGAIPPAVKGLDDPAFAEDDGCVCFQEAIPLPMGSMAGAFRRLRDWLIGKFGQDEAERAMPSWFVEDMEAASHRGNDINPGFSEEATTPTDSPAPEDTAVTPFDAARLAQENADLKARLDAATAAQAKAAADAIQKDNTAFAEGLAKEARIPADRAPLVAAALTALQTQAKGADDQPVQFGEGDETKPMHAALADFLKALPPQVEFGEVATQARAAGDADAVEYAEGTDPERIEADKKIRAHMKAHNVDYATAARAVLK